MKKPTLNADAPWMWELDVSDTEERLTRGMETKIRLARFGAKKKPCYRIVVASVTSSRDGRFLEVVGHYDPAKGVEKATVNREKVDLWMKRGAKPSDMVRSILKNAAA